MLAEQTFWHHSLCLAKTHRMIYFFCLRKVKFQVDLRSRSGHGYPGQYLDLGWSCCISLDSAAHSEHIGAFPGTQRTYLPLRRWVFSVFRPPLYTRFTSHNNLQWANISGIFPSDGVRHVCTPFVKQRFSGVLSGCEV